MHYVVGLFYIIEQYSLMVERLLPSRESAKWSCCWCELALLGLEGLEEEREAGLEEDLEADFAAAGVDDDLLAGVEDLVLGVLVLVDLFEVDFLAEPLAGVFAGVLETLFLKFSSSNPMEKLNSLMGDTEDLMLDPLTLVDTRGLRLALLVALFSEAGFDFAMEDLGLGVPFMAGVLLAGVVRTILWY